MIPGYAGLWTSGKLEEARSKIYPALYRGVINFGVVIFLFLLFSRKEAKIFFDTLAGDAAELTWLRMLGWSAAFYFPAVLFGMADYAVGLRFVLTVKASRAWRHFLMRDVAFEVSPRDNMFWEMFLCYRAVGKRPIIKIIPDIDKGDFRPLKGEVLKISWGLKPGILLADMDFPQDVSWVPLQHVKAVKFENPGVLPECGMLDHKTRELLNMIHPGYGDEVEEKYRKKLEI